MLYIILMFLLCVLAGVLGFGAAVINDTWLTLVLFLICLIFGALMLYDSDVNQKMSHNIEYRVPSEIDMK